MPKDWMINDRSGRGDRAYFKLDQYATLRRLMREFLRGVDRGVLVNQKIGSPNSWWPNRL